MPTETVAPPRGGVPAQRPSPDSIDIQHFGKPLRELSGAEFDAFFPGESAVADHPDQSLSWRNAIMSNVEEQAVRWLWPNRIALGKLNMLAGDPGLGKSFITCDLAARVSTGSPWPDGAANDTPGGVLLLNAEDDVADTIKPRLRAARADMARIMAMFAVDRGRLFSLAKHLEELARCASQLPDLRLIVIDPVTAFMSGIDSHKNADVREALAPLSELAERTGAAVLAVSHLNKGSGQAIYRTTGSLAFTAASRSVWCVAKDPQNRDRRVFLPMKNNLGNDKTGLAYSINGFSYPPFVDWEPDAVDTDIDAVLNREHRSAPSRQSATAAADEWLAAFLDGGEKASAEIYDAGKAAGFSTDQLKRASQRIGAQVKRAGMPSRSFWRLGGGESEPSADAEADLPVGAPDPRPQNSARTAPSAPSAPGVPEGTGAASAPTGADAVTSQEKQPSATPAPSALEAMLRPEAIPYF